MGVQAVVVPGKGVAACQASVDGTHANQMLVFDELQKGTDPAQIIELLSADPAFQSRQFGILDLQGRSAGHSGPHERLRLAGHSGPVPGTRDLLLDSGQHPAARRGRAERGEGVPRHQGRDHRSRDGGDGSGRRVRRRQPLHVSAAAGRRLDAGDSVRRQDRARRLHPDGGDDRHQRRLAQQRQVRDVPHGGAARRERRPERDPARARTSIR